VPDSQVASIVIAPATVTPCEPIDPAPVSRRAAGEGFVSPWKTFARACAGDAFTVDDERYFGLGEDYPEPLCEVGEKCWPTAIPPPPGFRQCILYVGGTVPECPDTYPLKHVFYKTFEDNRACTPCRCSQTEASDCSAHVTTYEDEMCFRPFSSNAIGDDAPLCIDVMPGVDFTSMSATWDTNYPGACEATGGQVVGQAVPAEPSTFCCKAEPGAGP
jgi:hypothetical protein